MNKRHAYLVEGFFVFSTNIYCPYILCDFGSFLKNGLQTLGSMLADYREKFVLLLKSCCCRFCFLFLYSMNMIAAIAPNAKTPPTTPNAIGNTCSEPPEVFGVVVSDTT